MTIKIQVDTAVEVFVNVAPLIASADFVTIDETIAYNEAGMDLNWNFITPAGVVSQTNVTPTTGGVYDWTHVGNGMYKIEIPASLGASINNDTEGVGWFSGVCTGVLPWISERYEFVPAHVIGGLVTGSDYLQVDAMQAEGADFTDTVQASAAAALTAYDPPTNAEMEARTIVSANYFDPALDTVAHVTLVDTTTTNTDMRGTDNALLAASAPTNFGDLAITVTAGKVTVGTNDDKTGYSISGTLTTLDALVAKILKYFQLLMRSDAAIETDNAAELTAINANGGSGAGDYSAQTDSGEALRDHIGDGTNLTEAGGTGDQLTAVPWNAAWDAEVQSECTDAFNAYDPPTNAEMVARTLLAASYFDPTLDTVAHVTLVDTTTTNTDMRGTDGANTVVPPTVAEMNARTLVAASYATAANQTNIEADTQDIQTRLPAALVGGKMNSDMTAINSSTAAAVLLALSAGTMVSGAAAAGTLSTTQMTTNLTEATNGHYNGRVIIWTSGALLNQATDITDYDGATKMLSYTAVTEAPSAADTFVIV